MRVQTGSHPLHQTTVTITWEHTDTKAVEATIDHLVDDLHQQLWPLGVNPTIHVTHGG